MTGAPGMRAGRRLGAWVVATLLAACGPLQAQPDAPAATVTTAADLREQQHSLPVTVPGPGGEASGSITVTSFRPPGDGPFPLAVVNHGRAIAERRAQQGRQRFEPLARYLVDKGFAVLVPTRLGYGDTYGHADPENAGRCEALQPASMARAASEQVLAVVGWARTLPWIDASRWVAIGQSVGGLAVTAVVARRPPGLVAAINFAGGTGGNPELRPGDPCSPQATERLWRSQAAPEPTMLWLYWRNDLYWGERWPARWAEAWREGGGRVEFHTLDPAGRDGHGGMGIDMDHWVPLVEDYLARAGYTRSGLPKRPPPSDYAALDDASRLPAGPVARDLYTRKFLAAPSPRAFALGPTGSSGWASGDWAIGRALGYCQARRGDPCKLYAVDDDVVWTP